MARRVLLLLLLLFSACGGASTADCGRAGAGRPQNVLFVGNSYTFVNNLPGTFAKLACSGGHLVRAEMIAYGGWTLADHVRSKETQRVLSNTRWDVVVLQEQSLIPALEGKRMDLMVPASRLLVGRIRAAGAKPVFFMTWGYRKGMPGEGLGDYAEMQAKLADGYRAVARDVGAEVAPVGLAWQAALNRNPALDLWDRDGSHPTPAGTYLAACVFYAVIFGQSPVGIGYNGGLRDAMARTLQAFAAETVFGGPPIPPPGSAQTTATAPNGPK